MHHLLHSLPVVGAIGLGVPELLIIFVALSLMLALPIGIVAIALSFKHRQRKMWHETARLALEKGQPLPTPPAGEYAPPPAITHWRSDVRTGLILIAVGVGLAVFFQTVGAREAVGVGAVPGCIGVALLLFGLFSEKKSGSGNPPPQA